MRITMAPETNITGHVVLVGDPVDGIFIYGPFMCPEDAIDWAEHDRCSKTETWWVTEIHEPCE